PDFICPFLSSQDNKCKIYDMRPFECQLYPFLINLRKGKVLLTVDLNCPYAYEKINSQEAKDYIIYLTNYLNSPKTLKVLKDNPQIIQAYEEVREIAELNLPHETK
ncbi:MAG: YkgJ family cysteine cluster protein, partial [Candidatus Omnitrophota bacterium]|nr:YkgJ family cysteine cluster protein [Candidatus Omnitrophota bacterium]